MNDVFISYSRKDQDLVRRLYEVLTRAGREVWVDWEGIPPSAEWMAEIQRAIDAADIFIIVITPNSLASRICEKELEYASGHNKKIIPVVGADVDEKDVPDQLRRLNWIFCRQVDDFDAGVQALTAAIETDLDWVRVHTGLLVRATEWEAKARDRSLMLRGSELREAESWLAKARDKKPELTPLQSEYVLVSRQQAVKRRWIASVGAASGLLVLGAVGGFMLWTGTVGLTTEAGLMALASRLGLTGFAGFPVPEMVEIPAGSFLMGSKETGWDHSDEGPQRLVTIGAFRIGKYEVTFEQYDAFVQATARRPPDDHGWGRGPMPVVDVSWDDAQAYAEWLSLMIGERYRLPTEAEWEYAARAGTDSHYWWGDEVGEGRANCETCGSRWDNEQTAPVGSFEANPFGLYDTAGNVHEWVQDCYGRYMDAPDDGSARERPDCRDRLLRGGSWRTFAGGLWSTWRNHIGLNQDPATTRNDDSGFRLAQDASAR